MAFATPTKVRPEAAWTGNTTTGKRWGRGWTSKAPPDPAALVDETPEKAEWAEGCSLAIAGKVASRHRRNLPQDAQEFGPIRPPPGLAWPSSEVVGSAQKVLQCASADEAAGAGFEPNSDRLVQLLQAALNEQDVQAKCDEEGFVTIQTLLKAKPELQKLCRCSATLLSAVEQNALSLVRVDKGRRRVRLISLEEVVREEAKRLMQNTPFGVLPVTSLLSSAVLADAMAEVEDAQSLLQAALAHASSEVILRETWLVKRPRSSKQRSAMEALFSEQSLAKEPKLRAKLKERADGEVPLTWIIARYSSKLAIEISQENPRSAEAAARDLSEALSESEVIIVDHQRLTARLAAPYPEVLGQAKQLAECEDIAPRLRTGVAWADNCQGAAKCGVARSKAREPPAKGQSQGANRNVAQLRQLLDFYFEPFTLQNNRFLLDLIYKRIPPPQEKGPWLSKTLLNLSFFFEDLHGLGRIMAAWGKLKLQPNWQSELQNLKHLRCQDDGKLQLSAELEVRSFVQAAHVGRELASSVVQYLSATREVRGQAPRGVVSVVSYAVRDVFADHLGLQGSQRQSKIKRQLLVHHADVICLQGLDVDADGRSVAAALAEEGYGFACARAQGGGEANSIFWDRSRWKLLSQEDRAASVSVLLQPFEDPKVQVRVVCLQGKMSCLAGSGLAQLFGASDPMGLGPLIACTDLSCLGGAEAAGIVEELIGLPSVAEEVLGSELAAPMPEPAPFWGNELAPARSASGLNRLRFPDAVFFRDMAPVTCLSGHTEGYLRTLESEEVVKQFPGLRVPIVAAFDWRQPFVPAGGLSSPAPCQRVRL